MHMMQNSVIHIDYIVMGIVIFSKQMYKKQIAGECFCEKLLYKSQWQIYFKCHFNRILGTILDVI